MSKKAEMKGVRFHLLCLLVGLVGLSLILSGTASYGQAQKTLIDLNSATEKELESIKGIGPATSKKIIDGRPYKSVDDLSKAGIPAKTIESIKPLVKVGSSASPAAPVSPVKPAAAPKAPAKDTPAKADPSASVPAAQKAAAPAASAVKTQAKAAASTAVKLAPDQKININKATKEQLEALPEIGPVKAQAIIDGRPYKKIDDVMKIKGIKEGTFGKIKDIIIVE
jgi:competence protein ComEA